MNILLTGKIDSIALHLINAAGNNRITIAAKNIPSVELGADVRSFSINPTDSLFEHVTRVGSFDTAVFFMARGDHADKTEGGVTSFQSMMEHCTAQKVGQIILVSSGEIYSGLGSNAAISENTPADPKGTQGFQIKAAEDMCRQRWKSTHANISVIRLPYIYQRKLSPGSDGLIHSMFKAVLAGRKKFELPGTPDTRVEFLSDIEAARLIWLVIDEGISSNSLFINAGTGKSTSFRKIADLFEEHYPDFSVSFSGDSSDVPPPMRTKVAKNEYGWSAINNLADDFIQLKDSVVFEPLKKFDSIKKFFASAVEFLRRSKSFMVIEYVLAAILLQILTNAFRGFTFSSWIDLRLLFVVILASLHGTIPGIVAGTIAGVMLFFSFGAANWRMIVYNPENWIPFGLYIIMGVALGSKVDRQVDNIKSTDDRLSLAEQTNVYLVELYDEAVRIKDSYRDQILGYKDNFGRIYSIVKKLNSEMSEYVFSSAIEVIEDVLQNKSVAVYSMTTRGDYARMTVSSKSIGDTTRSLRMSDYRQIMDKMDQHDIWFNRDLLPGFPSYCAPVYNDEKLIALVMIWRASVDQMTLHYNNLFKILSGLIQESLVRAVKYNKLRETTLYFPDTRILMQEPFLEAYKVNLSLAEKERAEFGLIVASPSGEITEQSVQLESCIRESDIIGTINDRSFGIILKNVSEDDIKNLLTRFKTRKIKAEQVSVPRMNELMNREVG